MLKISNISIDNMFAFGEGNSFNFDRGIYLVEGINHDRGGSNGAGKSSLFRSLTTALFEQNDIDRVKDNAIHKLIKKNGRIEVSFEKDGIPYKVIYARKHKELGSDIWLYKNGEQVDSRAERISGTLKKIKEIVGNYEFFSSVFYLPQSKFLKFITGKEKDRMDLLTDLLGLWVWDKADEAVKDIKKTNVASLEAKEKEVAFFDKRFKELRDAKLLKSMLSDLDNRIGGVSNQIKQLSEESKVISDELSKKRVETKRLVSIATQRSEAIEGKKRVVLDLSSIVDGKDCSSSIKDVDKKIEENMNDRSYIEGQIISIDDFLGKMNDSVTVCPLCGGKITKDQLKVHEKEMKEERESLVKDLSGLKEITEGLRTEKSKMEKEQRNFLISINRKKDLQSRLETIDKKLSELASVDEKELENLEAEVMKLEDRLRALNFSELSDLKSRLTSEKTMIESEMKDKLNSEEQLRKALSERNAREYKCRVDKFWEKHFKLIKRHKVEEVSEVLNQLINQNLDIVSEGVMQVKFQPFQVKDDGEVVNKFSLRISNDKIDDIDFAELSGGEKQLVAIAVLPAFWEYAYNSGIGCNVLILDEVFGALDKENRSRVAPLLDNFKKYDACILCVTHQDEIKELIRWDGMVKVEKTDGISKIKEVA